MTYILVYFCNTFSFQKYAKPHLFLEGQTMTILYMQTASINLLFAACQTSQQNS